MKNSDFLGQNATISTIPSNLSEKTAEIQQKPDNFQQKPQEITNFAPTLAAFPPFPATTLSLLSVIQAQMASNPHYLDLPSCPYTPEVKAFLRTTFGVKSVDSEQMTQEIDNFFGDKQIYPRIIADSKRAYMNLSNQMTLLEANKKIDDTIAFTKAITSLQERLLNIQEKAEGLKQIHEFKNVMLEVIGSELTPDQRTNIMQRLEAITQS